MQIDWIVTFTGAKMVVEHIPVSQEILQNIQPAPQTVLDAFDAQIPFVIPTPAISSCSP
jgi:hypothetical protein